MSTRRPIDPVRFVRTVLRNPETGKPFELYPAQEEFLRRAFARTADGRMLYPELVYGLRKKSGKTATGAMLLLYAVVVLGGKYAEGYCAANDLEQSCGRVFQAASRIVQASPRLLAEVKTITKDRIEFANGSIIQALASDYASAAGANPTFVVFDELWAYTTERSHRLFDELVPVPTREVSQRLTVTYAGFEGESDLLEKLYHRGLKGEEVTPAMYQQPGMLMLWAHTSVAPWQTPEWEQQMREQLRPNAYLRMIENRFVTSESSFVEMEWWDRCVDPAAHPIVADPQLPVWVGVDASVKRDATAIVAVTWDRAEKKARLVWHRTFQPSPTDPLDFEATIETTLRELRQRFTVREVRFDPWQMQAVAQRLTAAHVPMVEFPQSVPNLTESSTNLYELIKGQSLIAYANPDLRLAISRAVAIETARGWRITKEKVSHKIDVVVAMAMAALGAVSQGAGEAPAVCPIGITQVSHWRTPGEYYDRRWPTY